MKIGFLASHRGHKEHEKYHRAIISHFEKKGFEVVHSMDTTVDYLLTLSYPEREKIFVDFYKKLEECDIIFAECSIQSTQVGFGFSFLRSKGKPAVVLTLKGAPEPLLASGDVYSNLDNLLVTEYDDSTIAEVLDDALDYMSDHLDKRFTIIFPAHLMSELEEVSHKHKVPKAVFIRQLIEKALQEETSVK